MQQGDPAWGPREPSEACITRFQEVLRAHEGRFTEERRKLLDAVCSIQGHFLPEEVATLAERNGHKIATTTVYRNLPLLIEAGIVRRAPLAHPDERQGARYEVIWNRDHHDHLFCSRCGKEVEFHNSAIEILQEAVAREHGFLLQRHQHELIGICPECQAKREAAS